jgi:hypothetical protein
MTLKIPIIGELVRQMTTAQLTRSLATLLAGGITLVESFQIALQSVTNRELLRVTEGVTQQIRQGSPFTESLIACGWVPRSGHGHDRESESVLGRFARCSMRSRVSMMPKRKSSSAS